MAYTGIELLNKIRTNLEGDEQILGKRIIEFVYRDCFYNYFDKYIEEGVPGTSSFVYNFGYIKDNLEELSFGTCDSITSYFMEMLDDNKKEFITYFLETNSLFFDMYDSKLYRKKDFYPFSYIINLYLMLKAYHLYKNDIESFKIVVSDSSKLIDLKFLDDRQLYNGLKYQISILDKLIEMDYFKYECFRNFYNNALKSMVLYNTFEDVLKFSNYISDAKKIEKDYDYALNNEHSIALGNPYDIASKHLFDKNYPYYSKNLLYGERFVFVNDLLVNNIPDIKIRNYFFDKISRLNDIGFERLNRCKNFGEEDSFIKCLEFVFQSDTYRELDSRLDFLVKYSFFTLSGTLDDLYSTNHIPSFLDKPLVYESDDCNLTKKLGTVYERMKDVYSKYVSNEKLSKMFSVAQHKDTPQEYEEYVCRQITEEALVDRILEIAKKNELETKQKEEVNNVDGTVLDVLVSSSPNVKLVYEPVSKIEEEDSKKPKAKVPFWKRSK